MNKSMIIATLVASLGLAACGTLSHVDDKGFTDDPVFPDAEKVSFVTGSYPNVDNVRTVVRTIEHSGMTRDQLYNMLNRPHFAEGFKVREWDYLFHFNTNQGVHTCQFKVLFDTDRIARSYHWQPESCADLLGERPAPQMQPFSLSGDVGFEFDSAVLTPAGVAAVRDVAQRLKKAGEINWVNVSGHTDRIGSSAYNRQLSQERAEAVARVLAENGVPSQVIQARGYGDTQPRVQCHESNRQALIDCLAPNRRVDIDVQAKS